MSTALNNAELERWAATFDLPNFWGVFPDDGLPRFRDLERLEEWSLICNMSDMGEVGTHWIGLTRDGPTVKVFDSLNLVKPCSRRGLSCNLNRVLTRLLEEQSIDRVRRLPPTRIQSPLSELCGYFVLEFLYLEGLSRTEKSELGLSPYTLNQSKLKSNDVILMANFVKILSRTLAKMN